jgi:hypothetical protein
MYEARQKPMAASRDQSVSIQDRVHCADGGQSDLAMPTFDLLADLRSSPGGVFLLELNDEVLNLKRQSVGLSVRTSRTIGQSFQSTILIPIEDCMACLAGDIEFPAQHRHLLAFQQSRYKLQSFVHFGTLLRTASWGVPKAEKCCVRNDVPERTQLSFRADR